MSDNEQPQEAVTPADETAAETPAIPGSSSVRHARKSMGEAGKLATSALKKLTDKAEELEQLALLDEPEFEDAVLMDGETLRKKYTGAQAEKIEWRRDACLYMLGRECPVEEIAVVLRMNLRTISALAAQNGRKLAAFSEQFARELLADAASDIALARTKRDDASYKDLHIGAGIKLQHAASLKLVAELGDNGKPAQELEAETPELAAFRKKLKELRAAKAGKNASTETTETTNEK